LLGATPWAERAAAGLGLIRARPRFAGSAIPALTPQEQQVADMAAAGLTNKEIAAQLFLSVKTVEFHLHNTYAKAGVRSRTELSSRLRGNVESDHGDR
jgi:DNA-binding CsgD family transcriptional regulator